MTFKEARADFERQYVLASLIRAGGNAELACHLGGMDRHTLYRITKTHGINVSKMKTSVRRNPGACYIPEDGVERMIELAMRLRKKRPA